MENLTIVEGSGMSGKCEALLTVVLMCLDFFPTCQFFITLCTMRSLVNTLSHCALWDFTW